jgi:hypothetical protein
MPAIGLVNQQKISPKLECKNDRFRFPLIKIIEKRSDRCPIAHLMPVNPCGFRHRISARPRHAACVEFIPHRFRDVNVAVKPAQQVKLADCGQVSQRGGIADDDHRRPSSRSVSRSSRYSSMP